MKQWLKDFVHNCVVHPMMPFLPTGLANALHEVNGYWAFGRPLMINEVEIKLTRGGNLTHEELKQWQVFLDLVYVENKKPASEIRKLAQALVDDAMDGGPLKVLLKNQSPD